MAKRVAFIQTGGIGDLLTILPIADHCIEQGWEIVWPIDPRALEMFQRAKPEIEFIPVECSPTDPHDFFVYTPTRLIGDLGCDKTIMFYPQMPGLNIGDPRLARSLKPDEYKYAIAGVPFRKKWTLKYERDMEREQALLDGLNINGPYVCVHEESSEVKVPMPIPEDVRRNFQIVKIDERTDSIFDWRLALEGASHLFLVDSCFVKLVEQLNLTVAKTLLLNSNRHETPVVKSRWNVIYSDPGNFSAAEL